jgi:hypothetical protein
MNAISYACTRSQHQSHLAVNGICSGDDAAPRVQTGVDTSLGNRDRLLLHDFVDSHSVNVGHLVELIDADHATIGEDHGAGLEPSFARVAVGRNSGRETDAGATATSRRDREGCDIKNKPKKLRLGRRRIADHE